MENKKIKAVGTMLIAGCLCLTGCGNSVQGETEKKSEEYPNQNISWIVPAAAGAAIDIPTRALTDCIDLGSNIVIENIAGGSNSIGTLEVKNRDADGYTILTANGSGMLNQPAMYDAGYTPDDFRHIAILEPTSPYAVVVKNDSPVDSVEDWLNLIQNGEESHCAVSNTGSAAHLAIISCIKELECEENVTVVPYEGSAETLAAIQKGEVDFAILGVSDNIIPQAEAGNLKIIVVLNNEVCLLAPELPIISDYGVDSCDCFFGIKYVAVKKDTPDEIVEYLKEKINEGLSSDAYKKYLEQQSLGELKIYTEEELTGIIHDAYDSYSTILGELGMVEGK